MAVRVGAVPSFLPAFRECPDMQTPNQLAFGITPAIVLGI